MISPFLLPTTKLSYITKTLSTINLYSFIVLLLLTRRDLILINKIKTLYYYTSWKKQPNLLLNLTSNRTTRNTSFISFKIFPAKSSQPNVSYLTTITRTYSKNSSNKIATLRYAVSYMRFSMTVQQLFTFHYFRFFLTTFNKSYFTTPSLMFNLITTKHYKSKITNLHRFL